MKTVTLLRSDFRNSQDYPNESLFECVLSQLGIPEKNMEDIDAIDLKIESFEI